MNGLRVPKIDVPEERYDRLASPVSALAIITTVSPSGQVNAAPVATCVRNNHIPTCYEFSIDTYKDTAENVLATHEFVVNIVPFARDVLEKVRVASLTFDPGVNELEKAGFTALPSTVVRAPRIAECRSHFECRVEWSKIWLGTRLTVVGRVVAASVDADCIDEQGYVIHERMKPAHYCGHAYSNKFVAAHEVMEVGMIYDGPEVGAYPKVGDPPPRRR